MDQSDADVLARQGEAHEAVEKAARDAAVKVDADIRTRWALWLSVISMAFEAFGLGPKRVQRYFEVLQKNHDWLVALEADDDIVAYEKPGTAEADLVSTSNIFMNMRYRPLLTRRGRRQSNVRSNV